MPKGSGASLLATTQYGGTSARHRPDPLLTERRDVGILDDGTVHNPNGYPESIVRAAVMTADARRHERRSRAALKAAKTRQNRPERRVYEVAERLLAGLGIGPLQSCYVCRRGLDDLHSVERGIGPECWDDVLSKMVALRTP